MLLRPMYGVSGDGVYDRLTDFSWTVTSANWFVPAKEDLKAALAMT